MIFDHQFGNISIHDGSTVEVGFNFVNDIASGDTISTKVVTAEDDEGTSVTSSLILSSSVSSPIVYVVIQNTAAGRTYEVKIVATTTSGRTLTRSVIVDGVGAITLNPNLGDSNANSYVNLREANEYIKNRFYHADQWDNLTFEGRKRVLIQAARDIDSLNYKDEPYYDTQTMAFPRSDHPIHTGTASIANATSLVLRGTNLYSSTYNKIPTNHFKHGTVHIKEGNNANQIRYIQSSTATETGGYGEVTVSSPFNSNVVASDTFLIFEPLDLEIKEAQCEQALYIIENKYYGYADYQNANIEQVRTGDLSIDFRIMAGRVPSNLCLKARKMLGRYTRKGIQIGRA